MPKAEADVPEAMAALYDTYFYVEEPDEEGYANDDTEHLEAAEPWFREAAEAGYAPAMNNMAITLSHLERYEKAWEWMIRASKAGHINGRQWQASCYIEPEAEGHQMC